MSSRPACRQKSILTNQLLPLSGANVRNLPLHNTKTNQVPPKLQLQSSRRATTRNSNLPPVSARFDLQLSVRNLYRSLGTFVSAFTTRWENWNALTSEFFLATESLSQRVTVVPSRNTPTRVSPSLPLIRVNPGSIFGWGLIFILKAL
jgi:hypothetical protein